MNLPMFNSPEAIAETVDRIGFLPYFKNRIKGFSIEEHTPPELWFTEIPGPWEWKGGLASNGRCVYGKLFRGKAGYVSLDVFPDLANYRRDGYDFEGRYDEGLVSRNNKEVYDTLTQHGSLLSRDLKRLCGFKKGGNTGFDTLITKLQMQTFVVISDFEYLRDSHGAEYGWGVARYSTPEAMFGGNWMDEAYERQPAESLERCLERLRNSLPEAGEDDILHLLI